MVDQHNPKTEPDPQSNTEKDPDDWVTGDEPMTGAQGSYLKTLSEQAHDPDAFADESTITIVGGTASSTGAAA